MHRDFNIHFTKDWTFQVETQYLSYFRETEFPILHPHHIVQKPPFLISLTVPKPFFQNKLKPPFNSKI